MLTSHIIGKLPANKQSDVGGSAHKGWLAGPNGVWFNNTLSPILSLPVVGSDRIVGLVYSLSGYDVSTSMYTNNVTLGSLLNKRASRQIEDLTNLSDGLQLKYRDAHTSYIRSMRLVHKYANVGSQSSVSIQLVILNFKVGRRVLPIRSLVNRSVRSFFTSPMNISFKFMSPMWLTSILFNEPSFFGSYLSIWMSNVNMFTHRAIVRRLMKTGSLTLSSTPPLVLGIVIQFIGKISVGGNSRSRMLRFRGGLLAKSRLTTRVDRHVDIVWSVTGCLGLTFLFVT